LTNGASLSWSSSIKATDLLIRIIALSRDRLLIRNKKKEGIMEKRNAVPAVYAESLVFESSFGSAVAGGLTIDSMNESNEQFSRLLGGAALILWPGLPKEVQEQLFEMAAPTDDIVRNSLAVFLHEHHPRTAHPPKPTMLA
jgi:hypothetical protein